ncbi:MAG TPA: hypothetical protein VGZ25_03130, partial [Gemmataceae bacterium]|nr:hypothetical protein [Gemmataceae bacterium]
RAGTAMRVSAETGEGVADLGSQVARWLVPDPPAPGSAVPFTEAICSCLEGLAQSNSVNECLAGIEASLNQGQL